MKLGTTWKVINHGEDCYVGKACWGANHLYMGTLNDYQVFTTPSGCTDSATPTCAGGADLTKEWATTAPEATTQVANYSLSGPALSALVAAEATTLAAQFCEAMTYAGYNDWYLPRPDELALLFQASKVNTLMITSGLYWSNFDDSITPANAYALNVYQMYSSGKTNLNNVRCFRRF